MVMVILVIMLSHMVGENHIDVVVVAVMVMLVTAAMCSYVSGFYRVLFLSIPQT